MRAMVTAMVFAAAAAAWPVGASAVPAFAEQTGQPCSACHVGGFGPQLTPFGRQFKLNGYTMRAGDSFTNPLSAMAVVSYVHTLSDQPSPPASHYAVNDNTTLDQASLFVAGGVGDHFGGFTQWTYDGVGRAFSWDNLDLRAVDNVTLDGNDVLLGVNVNNAPAVQDAWNTLPAWGYPYTGSDLAPAPGAGTVMDGALAQGVLGASAYANWNSSLYTEFGLYWTPSRGFLSAMGVDRADVGLISGAAPYARIAWQKDYGEQNFEIGAFGLFPNIYPGADRSAGTTDRYSDVGLDGSYQFTGDETDTYTLNVRYTHEDQTLDASAALGAAAHAANHLDEFNLDASYYWHNEMGGTIGFFDIAGSRDTLFYADNRTFRPDSQGLSFQADYTPFGGPDAPLGGRFNLRVGVQYVAYTKFDGASSNYDGLGHGASDNNTLRVFLWTAL